MWKPIAMFTVPGKPFGKQRPRHMRNGHTYTPKETVSYENLVKVCFMESDHPELPTERPVRMVVEMTMPIPTSWSKKKQANAFGQYCITKPDCSNAVKCLEDGLLGLAYRDDSQIVDLEVVKQYGLVPGCEVWLYEHEGKEE